MVGVFDLSAACRGRCSVRAVAVAACGVIFALFLIIDADPARGALAQVGGCNNSVITIEGTPGDDMLEGTRGGTSSTVTAATSL